MKRNQIFKWIGQNWAGLVVLGMIALGAWGRLSLYRNLRLSIGTGDTPSYIASSRAPLFSREMFAGRRLFTTNLLYKLANSETCEPPLVVQPRSGAGERLAVNECFGRITLTQHLLSVLGWSVLAWTFARRLRQPLFKILAAFIILAFGFTPQIAEWDAVLSSESLSFSLFPLVLALTMELAFHVAEGRAHASFQTFGLAAAAVIALLLWMFVRDAHQYVLLALFCATSPLLFFSSLRRLKFVLPILLSLVVLFLVVSNAAHHSTRWQPSVYNTIAVVILPFPERAAFLAERGMPDPASTEEFDAWFNEHGDRAYGSFLLAHPGYVFATLFQNWDAFATDAFQPYYFPNNVRLRNVWTRLGDLVHPATMAVYLIDLLLLASIVVSAFRRRDGESWTWAWLAVWFILYAAVSTLLSFFGDINGSRRHIIPSVESFRLYLWIFLFVNLDR